MVSTEVAYKHTLLNQTSLRLKILIWIIDLIAAQMDSGYGCSRHSRANLLEVHYQRTSVNNQGD